MMKIKIKLNSLQLKSMPLIKNMKVVFGCLGV